jgi:hypothetical protein
MEATARILDASEVERLALPRFVDYSLRFIAPISLCLAIYYHYQAVQERVPRYYVSPTRARIVDTSIPAPPQLQVLYKGKDLNANVSAVVVYFWNDGKLSIKGGRPRTSEDRA